jgi:plasmid stability protein
VRFIPDEEAAMADLIIRTVDDAIANALQERAKRQGISAEAEHRRILERALLRPRRKSLVEVLRQMPDVGCDEDFARHAISQAAPSAIRSQETPA